MRPVFVYANPAETARQELLGLLHGPWRVATRAVMIVLSARGWSPAAIAELLGYHPRTVRRWVQRYNTTGPTDLTIGLADRPRTGRPRLGSRRLGQHIRTLLSRPRAWTIPLLHLYLGRPAMSLATLHRRVREIASWRRPRLVARGDPDTDQVVAAVRQAIAELPEGSVVLAEDETHLHLLPWVRATWILNGHRQQVMTPGSNRRRSIFGAVDLASGRWFYQLAHKAVSATFIAFLGRIVAGYPTAPAIAIVLDNVTIHRSKAAMAWLAAHPQVRLVYGARYSPHHNPVERIWGALKAYLANSPTLTMAGRLRQVHAFFRHRTPDQLLHTAAPSGSPWLPAGYGQNIQEAA